MARIPGVQAVDADAQTGRLVVRSPSRIDDEAVLSAVDQAGYTAACQQPAAALVRRGDPGLTKHSPGYTR